MQSMQSTVMTRLCSLLRKVSPEKTARVRLQGLFRKTAEVAGSVAVAGTIAVAPMPLQAAPPPPQATQAVAQAAPAPTLSALVWAWVMKHCS